MQDDLEQRVAAIIKSGAYPSQAARAIIPMVLEEAAKVAEERRKIFVHGPDVRQYVTFSPSEVAAAIRAIGAP